MKIQTLLPLILLSALLACSGKREGSKNIQEAPSSTQQQGLVFYQSDKFPIRIDYLPGLEMKMRTPNDLMVIVNLFNEFKDEFLDILDADESMAWDDVFTIDFFPTENDFKDYLSDYISNNDLPVEQDVTMYGNMPVVHFKNAPTGAFLLTPGHYGLLIIQGSNLRRHCDECSKEHENRLADITRKTLKNIIWQKSIDTDSQEFKGWKAHILSLIEEARQSAAKKK